MITKLHVIMINTDTIAFNDVDDAPDPLANTLDQLTGP